MKAAVRRFCFLLAGLLSHGLHAQEPLPEDIFRSIAGMPYPERAEELKTIKIALVNVKDRDSLQAVQNRLYTIARNTGDRELMLETELLHSFCEATAGSYATMERDVHAMRSVMAKAKNEKAGHVALRALKIISEIYWNNREYELAFETFFELEQALHAVAADDFPDKADYLVTIGECYYFFQDYRQAIQYLEEAAALPETSYNALRMVHARNNLGLCYQHLGMLDESDRYFREIRDNTQGKEWETWESIAAGNLGYNAYLRKRYNEAEPLFRYDIDKAVIQGDFGLAAGSLIPLADMHIAQNRLKEAGQCIRLAREYINASRQPDRLRLLYPVMSKWHAALGEGLKAAAYVDSTTEAVLTYNRKFNALKLLRAEQKIAHQQQQMLLAEKQQQLALRNFIIGIVFFLFAIALAGWIFRNRYLLRKQQLKELELAGATRELEHAQSMLEGMTRRFKENSTLLEQLQSRQTQHPVSDEIISRLKSSTLLTEDDWSRFKALFEQVHHGYLDRLRETYPELTPAEIRFLVLEKLRFTRKEMAGMLGVSPESLRVTWHRIRKKLDLPEGESASHLADTVEEV